LDSCKTKITEVTEWERRKLMDESERQLEQENSMGRLTDMPLPSGVKEKLSIGQRLSERKRT